MAATANHWQDCSSNPFEDYYSVLLLAVAMRTSHRSGTLLDVTLLPPCAQPTDKRKDGRLSASIHINLFTARAAEMRDLCLLYLQFL